MDKKNKKEIEKIIGIAEETKQDHIDLLRTLNESKEEISSFNNGATLILNIFKKFIDNNN